MLSQKFVKIIALTLSLLSPGLLLSNPTGSELGDYYYRRGQYHLAQIEFDRQLLPQKKAGRSDNNLSSRQALTLMHQKRWNESISYLTANNSFQQLYLRMYASLRMGYVHRSQIDFERIQDLKHVKQDQKDLAQLLVGSRFLEYGDYGRARLHFDQLQKKSNHPDVQQASSGILISLEGYQSLSQKNALWAGILSTIMPGAGQIYSEHYVDGGVAFFFNTMFLGSAIVIYDLENQADRPHTASLISGIIGIGFYISNILGGYKSAHRYNIYHQRKFHQDIRRHFFQLDFIEKTSGVEFQKNF